MVQTISESQQDLGIRLESLEQVSAGSLRPGVKVRVRGFSKPVILRRVDGVIGGDRGGAAADEGGGG